MPLGTGGTYALTQRIKDIVPAIKLSVVIAKTLTVWFMMLRSSLVLTYRE